MPLITRRSSTRALPRVSVGRCGLIFENCAFVSQNWSRLIYASFSEAVNHATTLVPTFLWVQTLVSLFQLNRVEVTAFIQLSAPYLVRCLMFRGTDIQDGAKPHIEIAHFFQSIDQLLGIQLWSNALQAFNQYLGSYVALKGHIISCLAGKILCQRFLIIEDCPRIAVYRRDNLGDNYPIRKPFAL